MREKLRRSICAIYLAKPLKMLTYFTALSNISVSLLNKLVFEIKLFFYG